MLFPPKGKVENNQSESRAENVDKHSALEKYTSEKYVLFIIGFSLNVSMSTYLSYVNVYGAEFSRAVLGWMSICIFGSSAVIVYLQGLFDAHFDEKDAKRAYTFRIGLGLIAAVGILFAIPFAKQVWHVYLLGLICGIFEGAAISSLNQLAAAIHPEMTKYANTGLTFGPIVPVILSYTLGFHHEHASTQVKMFYAWLPAVFPTCAVIMLLVVIFFYPLEGFHQGLRIIQRRASRDDLSAEQMKTSATENTPLAGNGGSSSSSSSSGSASWSWLQANFLACGIVQILAHGLARGLMPFLSYFGDLTLAHVLVLNSFVSEIFGRIVAHVVTLKALGAQSTKGIIFLAILTVVRTSLCVLLMLQIFVHFNLGNGSLHVVISMFYFLYGWIANEVQVIVVEMGPREEESEITRGMMLFNYGGQIVSLCVAVPVIAFALGD